LLVSSKPLSYNVKKTPISSTIKDLQAMRVWDSRGFPTVEVEVITDGGYIGRAIAPAGASRGTREAIDLRDGGARLAGKDVQHAIAAVDEIIRPALLGMDVSDQESIDACLIALDGTPLKAKLGGNATVATSLAVLHAAASASRVPLWQYLAERHGTTPSIPLPEIQIFGGGAHAGRRVDIQDFMVMVPGAKTFAEALEVTAEIYHAAGSLMKSRGKLAGVADEGGWWPSFDSNTEALDTLMRAIELAGEKPGARVVISLDIAASEFGSKGRYRLALENRELDTEQMIAMLGQWLSDYPIASIEDPLAEDDPDGMRAFTQAYGSKVQIIGDDYLVTNAKLVDEAINFGACNAVLIKPNQAGTVSESLATFRHAQAAGWGTIVSARSGETEDVSIVHLSIGLNAQQLKVGSFARSERMIKWNEVLRISKAMGGQARFSAGDSLAHTWWARK
jgi:enolase